MPRRLRRPLAWWAGTLVTLVAVAVVVPTVDTAALAAAWDAVRAAPGGVLLALGLYGLAFVIRAVAWRRVLPDLPLGHALAALHVSLAGNHLLPLRLGEPLRVTSVVRRAGIPLGTATASTVLLRAADVVAVTGLGLVLGAPIVFDLAGAWAWALLAAAAASSIAAATWLGRLRGRGERIAMPGPTVAFLTLASWVLEGAVIWQAARWAGVDLTIAQAVLVTAVTIAAQIAAVAPGGFGTYEAAATTALVTLGVDAGTGLAVALTAHAVKTAYALATGAVALAIPGPGLLGRVRLARRGAPPAPDAAAAELGRPVVLFLPAHDEEASVGDVVRRAPAEVRGHPVRVLVIDDGSTDATSEVARRAGAEVVRLERNRGLGAAVRRGFAEGVARDAVAVAFCDADGEYAPEELADVVGPILDGQADYVVGSRFAGDIERMLPHRRLGNRVLTALVRFVSRQPVTDGQSGYRALSADAATRAEVIHDYNYAQVLTLDLLAKGYRYREVPIRYHFRQQGRSFVSLGRYLRAVVPAVYREVNGAQRRP